MAEYPLILLDENGAVLDAAMMNPKSFNKSREHGKLWHFHAETGRVLPYRNGLSYLSLVDRKRWYAATVTAADWVDASDVLEDPQNPLPTKPAVSANFESAEPDEKSWGDVLRGLEAVIADRKINLPVGSYTTYLFNAGESKIRKKIGEEAVELILAHDKTEVSSEAADLVYHLMVLLAELGISFDEVIAELAKRE